MGFLDGIPERLILPEEIKFHPPLSTLPPCQVWHLIRNPGSGVVKGILPTGLLSQGILRQDRYNKLYSGKGDKNG